MFRNFSRTSSVQLFQQKLTYSRLFGYLPHDSVTKSNKQTVTTTLNDIYSKYLKKFGLFMKVSSLRC